MYFITGFTKYEVDERTHVPDIGSARTFGYYANSSDAKEAVRHNFCDIFESMYDYMVIEHIEEGLYQLASGRLFFKWNDKQKKYEEIDPIEDCWGNYAFG
jgi:hypothetical protein